MWFVICASVLSCRYAMGGFDMVAGVADDVVEEVRGLKGKAKSGCCGGCLVWCYSVKCSGAVSCR